jgi:hypothetical protein
MPLNNYNVCARASTAFVLLVLVLFAFASRRFLYYSFAFLIIISCVCCDLNFLVCFLLYKKDCVKVSIVVGT